MAGYKIELMDARPYAYITRTAKMDAIPSAMAEGFGALGAMFARAGAEMAGMPMAHYRNYDGKTTTFDLGFPCRSEDADALAKAGLAIGETPSGRTMTATHIGPYDTVVVTYDAMTAAMKSQGLQPATDMWEVYWSPPETPPAEIRADIVWPIAA